MVSARVISCNTGGIRQMLVSGTAAKWDEVAQRVLGPVRA